MWSGIRKIMKLNLNNMNSDEKERLYLKLNSVLELLEGRNVRLAIEEVEALIQKVQYDRL